MSLPIKDGTGIAATIKSTLDGSDHVTHQKIDSVAGTVAATQSGAWNVTPLAFPSWTAAGSIGHAEDAAHTTGDVGVLMLGVRANTAAAGTGSDGDYAAILTDSTGRIHANAIRSGDGVGSAAEVLTVKNAFAAVAIGTDGAIIAAVATKKLRVVGAIVTSSGTATVVFTSKPGGAGAAISATFNLVAGVPLVLPPEVCGWFQTAAGEGLSATVATTAIACQVLYMECA